MANLACRPEAVTPQLMSDIFPGWFAPLFDSRPGQSRRRPGYRIGSTSIYLLVWHHPTLSPVVDRQVAVSSLSAAEAKSRWQFAATLGAFALLASIGATVTRLGSI